VESDDGVVVVGGLINDQAVRRLLPLQDRRRVVLLPLPARATTGKPSPNKSPTSESQRNQPDRGPGPQTLGKSTRSDRPGREGREAARSYASEAEADGSPWLAMLAAAAATAAEVGFGLLAGGGVNCSSSGEGARCGGAEGD